MRDYNLFLPEENEVYNGDIQPKDLEMARKYQKQTTRLYILLFIGE